MFYSSSFDIVITQDGNYLLNGFPVYRIRIRAGTAL